MPSPVTSNHLLLFGDQSVEGVSAIRSLVLHSKTSPTAKRFLNEATDTVQLELSLLSKEDHGWNHGIGSLLELAEKNEASGSDNLILSTMLMTVGRLGQLISHAENDTSILGSTATPINIVALCGGLLPAAAAVAATDTSELYALSHEIISIAFRLACEVHLQKRLIDAGSQKWGKTFIGITRNRLQDILTNFHESENIPEFRKIAIGAVAKDWLTLIGPPSSLERLESWSSEIKQTSCVQAAVFGPIHTKYVPAIDVAKVLGDSELLNCPIDPAKARVISPGSCKPYEHYSLKSLLTEMVEDIAHNPLHVTDSISACISKLETGTPVKLSVMGPTNHLAAVKAELIAHAIQYEITNLELRNEDKLRTASGRIAVVGMSGRFPGSDTIDGFWEDLLAAKCHITEVPKSRFDIDAFFDPTANKKNSTSARHGAWLNNPGLFDHRLFNISPREAAQMDPGHRLLLTVAYEALQASGYNPDGSLANASNRIATYFGQVADEWREVLNQKGADIYYVPGFSRAFAPGRLNHYLKWSGGSFSVDTACSTSATTVVLASSALLARECDMALAGGCSVLNSPTTLSGLSRAGMLSTTGGCRTYHEDADGYARGEGVGVVVLKRLEDAVRENDNILAVIRGSVRTHSPTATSITHPCAASQQATYNQVLSQCGLNPDEVAYVEMHGTGTQAGDVEEVNSVVDTFAKQRQARNPLVLGAVKASVGHGEGAAGVTSLIKMILMLRERTVPPQPGWPFQANSKFPPLRELNVQIATKRLPLKPSPVGDKKLKMVLNSFDASGGNVSMVVEEPPRPSGKTADIRAWHTVAISAKTRLALQDNQARLLEYLERHPSVQLADLSYSTTARRIHEPLRCAFVADSVTSIVRQLRSSVGENSAEKVKLKSKSHNHIFLFTGQGSQYPGMGATLYHESPEFRNTMVSIQDMVTKIGLPFFLDLISDDKLDVSSCSTVKIQLATAALEISLAQTMKKWGVTPDAVIGHSLGEYASLCAVGVLSISDTMFLVGKRAELMEAKLVANEYGMLATSVNAKTLQGHFEALKLRSCAISCFNTPSTTVTSGTVQDIAALQNHLEEHGAGRTTLLRVPYGFHSTQVDPILSDMERLAKTVDFMKPVVPVISTLTGKVERDGAVFCPSYLARQAREPVRFVSALESCQREGLCGMNSIWLEFGPNPVCLGLARQTLQIPTSRAVPLLTEKENNWHTVSKSLAQTYSLGVSINWPEFHKSFKASLSLLELPGYAFEYRDFWTRYEEQASSVAFEGKSQPVAPSIPGFPTSSLQNVESEVFSEEEMKVVFTSEISERHLQEAISGHEVNGEKICHLGLFHDMALSASQYIYGRMEATSKLPNMTAKNMEIANALILRPSTMQATVCVTAWHRLQENVINIEVSSQNRETNTLHAKCQVLFTRDQAKLSHLGESFLIRTRIESLRERATSGKAHLLRKGVVYRLFSGVVSYAPAYQGLQEVVLDGDHNDAVGTIELQDSPGVNNFNFNPYWTDAVMHLAGFVLNSGLKYQDDYVCLSSGFDEWRSAARLSSSKTYTAYVCVQEVAESCTILGNCFVFCGKEFVQATIGLKFLKLRRAALTTLFSKLAGNAAPSRAGHRTTLMRSKPLDKAPITLQSGPEQSGHGEAKGCLGPQDVCKRNTPDQKSNMVESILEIIANEIGCAAKDMLSDTMFRDLGIDSLMAISILSTIEQQMEIELPASFFLKHETIGEAKSALSSLIPSEADADQPKTRREQSSDSSWGELTSPTSSPSLMDDVLQDISFVENKSNLLDYQPSSTDGPQEKRDPGAENKNASPQSRPSTPATVVQYRGAQSSNALGIFFIAGETGSTIDYIQLPNLGPDFGVYGVEPPDLGRCGDTVSTVQKLAGIYKFAIQSKQPTGPYIIGGTSIGAVFAFEVANELLRSGEQVKGLLLGDCHSTRADALADKARRSLKSALLSPKEKVQVEKMASLVSEYRPSPSLATLQPGTAMQILRQETSSHTHSHDSDGWQNMIHHIQTRQLKIDNGSLLQLPALNDFAQSCQDFVAQIME